MLHTVNQLNKKLTKLKNTLGFTVIELLICIVIFSVVLIITTQSVIIVTRKSGLVRLRAETNENARYVIETIKRQLRETSSTIGGTNPLDCINNYCTFSTSSKLNPTTLLYCAYEGKIVKYTTPSGTTCPQASGVNVENVSNDSIMYVKSLTFEAPNVNVPFYTIKIEYTDPKGTLCKTNSAPNVCSVLSSSVIVRKK